MNEQDKELYEQAEKYADVNFKGEGGGAWVEAFESKFADLIRADEREQCAKIARDIGNATEPDDWALDKCQEIETAIRARGEA